MSPFATPQPAVTAPDAGAVGDAPAGGGRGGTPPSGRAGSAPDRGLRATLARLVAALPVRPSRLVLGALIALSAGLAVHTVVSPGSVDWGAVSFSAVAALAATALTLYG
ncbi:MAG TPA: hypothetical protein VJ787_10245, partial [Thermoleophilia bacterium]|nr:hypothetical protein [Thermoleophilia bacterium]